MGRILGTLVAAFLAVPGMFVVLHEGEDDLEARVARDMPKEADYSFVALPTTPAPGHAFVETSHYADPVKDGQVILLQYPGFTLFACSAIAGVTRSQSCAPRGRELLRTVEEGDVVTVFSIGGKFGPAEDSESEEVRAWIERADGFVTRPEWVRDFASQQLERMYKG